MSDPTTNVAPMSEEPNTWSHLDRGNPEAHWHLDGFSYWKTRAITYGFHEREADLMDLSVLKKELNLMTAISAWKAIHEDDLSWDQVGKALGITPPKRPRT